MRKKKDLFEYLSKDGLKNEKLALYEELKVKKDLEECTFKPQISKRKRAQSVYKKDKDL